MRSPEVKLDLFRVALEPVARVAMSRARAEAGRSSRCAAVDNSRDACGSVLDARNTTSCWVKSLGRIEIGIEPGQGFMVRALDERGMVFEDTKSKSLGEALTTLERKIAKLDD